MPKHSSGSSRSGKAMSESPEKGYTYYVTDEQIERYRRLTPEQKLNWLEEANGFTNKFLPERSRKLHRLFREGKI